MARSPQRGPAAAAAAADWSPQHGPINSRLILGRNLPPPGVSSEPCLDEPRVPPTPYSQRASPRQGVRQAARRFQPTIGAQCSYRTRGADVERRQETTKKRKNSFAGLRFLIGSRWGGPWVKGQSGQSCIGSTSCRSSPTSCPRWGRSAGQCSGRTTPSGLPPRRGSCPR